MKLLIKLLSNKLLSFSFLLLLSSSLTFSVLANEPKSIQSNERILFVGNSFSYFNNGLHNHVSNLVRASGKWTNGKSQFRLMTISGGKLKEHQAGLNSMLSNRQWNKVILQAHSNEPITRKRKKSFIRASQILSKMVRKTGAEPIFFMSWAYKDQPEMTGALKNSFIAIANSLDAQVVPVGLAFADALKEYPEINLYTADIESFDANGKVITKKAVKHPSLAGTYLAACVFYAFLYQQTPEGLPYTAGLPIEDIKHLQQIAWKTVSTFDKQS